MHWTDLTGKSVVDDVSQRRLSATTVGLCLIILTRSASKGRSTESTVPHRQADDSSELCVVCVFSFHLVWSDLSASFPQAAVLLAARKRDGGDPHHG